MVHRLLFRNWSGKMGSGVPLTGTNRVRIKFYARMRLHRPKNMRDPDKHECTLDRSKNKQDILKKKKRNQKRGGCCCCQQSFASENLSHHEARYVFPSVEYKSPSPARFEERYKRVGSYYFHPESRSLSNGLSSYLPSLGQRNEAEGEDGKGEEEAGGLLSLPSASLRRTGATDPLGSHY